MWLLTKFLKYLIPPSFIDNVLSGASKSKSTFCKTPKPLQFSHIPLGELNENNLGSIFGISKSPNEQLCWIENIFVWPSNGSIETKPPE